GQLNGAGLSSGGVQLIYKDFAVMGFPLIFKDYNEYDNAVGKMDSFFKEELEKKDFVLMAWTEVGFIYVFSKKKVNSVETLSSSKPIVMEGDIISKALYDELNIKPVPLQMSDILTSLQTGQIDTIFSSTYGLIVTQWFTKVNFMADFPITFMIGAVVIDKATFYSMPKEYQTLMATSFKENFRKLSLKVRKDNDNARVSLEKYGIKVLSVNDTDKQKFYDVIEKAYGKLTEKEYSKDVLNKVKDVVKEYRTKKK
ncbi:MAG TPA: TRAP transporter substrate-binding protein DctP, partial [Spirochaetota bacterium]|nr:TRAP transporter substrate-binding protein DctP [Spirochaetota bacterium]